MDDSTQDPYGPLNELKKPSNVFTAVRELQAAQQPQDSAQADASEEVFASTGVMVVDELIAPAPDVTVLDPTDTTFYGAGVTGGGRTFGSLIMNFWAVAAGVLQVGFNNLGQLLAGAGAVILDAVGILFNRAGVFFEFNNTATGAGELGYLEMIPFYGLSLVSFHATSQKSVGDPTFEAGGTGWTFGLNAVISTDFAYSPTHSAKFINALDNIINSSYITVSGTQGLFSLWIFSEVTEESLVVELNCYDAGSALLGVANNLTAAISVPGSWTRYIFAGTYPTGTTKVKLSIKRIGGTNPSYVDNISLFDGSGFQLWTASGKVVFSGDILATNLAGANTGDVTIGTANGLSLAGQALSLAAATDSVPGAMTAADHTAFSKTVAGTYTPTLTNTTNVAASTSAQCNYMRVGNQVTVSGRIAIDPTAVGATLLEISLPIASNIGGAADIGGTAACGAVAGVSAAIDGNAANDTANLSFVAVDTANRVWTFIFMYEIL